MRIAIIGLGDIATKAYLPILTLKENIELVLCTRNKEVLNRLAKQYKISEVCENIEQLLEFNVNAAIVCTHAGAHFNIVKKLIENGIDIYVDKPISFNFKETKEIARLAKEHKKIVMVGFNRRFVPMFRSLKDKGNADIIIMQKNREYPPGDLRRFIVEDFIHVVDTLRFLMNEEIKDISVSYKKDGNNLENVVVNFIGDNTTAIGIMNRTAGITEEIIEYMVKGNKYVVEDLVETTKVNNDGKTKNTFGGWETSLYKRGFNDLLDTFITSVKEGITPEPSIEDSLITHEICENIINKITSDNKVV